MTSVERIRLADVEDAILDALEADAGSVSSLTSVVGGEYVDVTYEEPEEPEEDESDDEDEDEEE